MQSLSVLLSQHDDDAAEDEEDEVFEDEDEAYKNMMEKPLFAVDE